MNIVERLQEIKFRSAINSMVYTYDYNSKSYTKVEVEGITISLNSRDYEIKYTTRVGIVYEFYTFLSKNELKEYLLNDVILPIEGTLHIDLSVSQSSNLSELEIMDGIYVYRNGRILKDFIDGVIVTLSNSEFPEVRIKLTSGEVVNYKEIFKSKKDLVNHIIDKIE